MTSPSRRKRQTTRRKGLANILDALAGGRACAAAVALAFAAQFATAGEKLQWVSPGVAPKSASNWSAKGQTQAKAAVKPHTAVRAEWNTFTSAPNLLQPAADVKPLSAASEVFDPFASVLNDGSRVIQTSLNEPVADGYVDPFGGEASATPSGRRRLVSQNQSEDLELPGFQGEKDGPDQDAIDMDAEEDSESSLDREFARGGVNSLDECPSPDDLKGIGEISIDITPPSPPQQNGVDLPKDCPLGGGYFVPRSWACTTYTWKASGLCHKPLYFEQIQSERYGHSFGPILQPVVSGAHFFASVPLLPYKMGMNPPWECEYVLGYYRPGSCAPYVIDPLPISVRGAVVQGLVTAGVIVGFP